VRDRREHDERNAWAALILLGSTVALAWTISQKSGVWVPRYFAVFVGPFLIALGWAFSRARVVGIAGLVILSAGFWLYPHSHERLVIKSNVKLVALDGAQRMKPGDLVLITHPEQTPLVHYYMTREGGRGLRYATQLGYAPDTGVFDWRDCVERLRRTSVPRNLEPMLDSLPVGRQLYLIRPIVSRRIEWRAPWTGLVRKRSAQWLRALEADKRFRRIHVSHASLSVGHRNGAVQGRLYVKTRS
jgi:hypothetical protein